ncbi:hypothetical protein QTN25_006172 [Entamoeba marina]
MSQANTSTVTFFINSGPDGTEKSNVSNQSSNVNYLGLLQELDEIKKKTDQLLEKKKNYCDNHGIKYD